MTTKHSVNEENGDRPLKRVKTEEDAAGRSSVLQMDVGITEYVSPSLKPLHGIIKQRFTDFIVKEIDNNGDIVHLTSFEIAGEEARKSQAREQKALAAKQVFEWPSDAETELTNLKFTEEQVDQIKQMYESRGRAPNMVTSASIDDKVQRTNLHQTIRKVFQGKIVTTTGDDDAIVLKFSSSSRDPRNVQRGPDWKTLGGEYLQFVLYKENRDTMDAVSYIAKLTKQHTRKYAYAGTKDRRGVTTQLLTVHRFTADRIKGLNRALRGMRVGNFKYVQDPLELGQLKGNEFLISLRNVIADADAIDAAMTSLRDRGFVNYYGMQRFGTSSLSTHEIGKAVIQGRWEEAIELILGPRKNDTTDSEPARRHWKETHDANSTLKMFSQRNIAEQAILRSFAKNGNNKNAAGALSAVPRNMRLLYAHAYQSYVWNRVVSERVKMGMEVLEGDLVVEGEIQETAEMDEVDMEETAPKPWKPSTVRALTMDDLSNYSIYDIVLPTPGTAVTYPTGLLGEAYVKIMAEDGLDPHDLFRKVREYSLSGNYRRVISKPSNLSWEVVKYNDGDQQLALTDLDRLNHMTLEPTPDGQFTALQIRMSLSTAQYATMALREVTKEETSSSAQAALTDLGRDKL